MNFQGDLMTRRQVHQRGGFFPGYFFDLAHPKFTVGLPDQLKTIVLQEEFLQRQLENAGPRRQFKGSSDRATAETQDERRPPGGPLEFTGPGRD